MKKLFLLILLFSTNIYATDIECNLTKGLGTLSKGVILENDSNFFSNEITADNYNLKKSYMFKGTYYEFQDRMSLSLAFLNTSTILNLKEVGFSNDGILEVDIFTVDGRLSILCEKTTR